jgi:hypothetical protein
MLWSYNWPVSFTNNEGRLSNLPSVSYLAYKGKHSVPHFNPLHSLLCQLSQQEKGRKGGIDKDALLPKIHGVPFLRWSGYFIQKSATCKDAQYSFDRRLKRAEADVHDNISIEWRSF